MDPQLKAIESIDRNVAVNAGAGTGKTKVLTERFIYILENGNLEINKEVESIVAITFTKKATQEMVERIRREIRNNFSNGDKWSRFYRDMEKANISTIHSFCGKILRENPIESKIDPLFEVLEEGKSNELLNLSIKEALNVGLDDKDMFKLMLVLKEFRTQNLVGDIKGVYNLIRTVGLSFEQVKLITQSNLNSLKIEANDLSIIKDTIIYLQGKLGKASKIVKLVDNPIWEKFKNDLYIEEELFSILELLKESVGTSQKEQDKIELLKTTLDKALMAKEANYKWLYSSFLDLLILVDELYKDKKNRISGLDYDDLQIKVFNLLDDEVIRKKYQAKFKYIMIDEFQDTNELQKMIFYKLASDKSPLDLQNLFVVGDPKQSIYAFRGADINVFYNVLEDIKEASKEQTITLSKNYRSVDTVLSFINDIFKKLMDKGYDQLDFHHLSENKIDIEILEDTDFESDSEKAIIFEANLIAKKIKKLVSDGKYNYSDFALLFRATTRNFYYEEALKNYNIPYYNSSSKRFFYRQEILDIINALKAISNPYDKISAIGFLRGPMVGLNDNTLFWLLSNTDVNIYKTLINFIEEPFRELPEDEIEKIVNAKLLLDYFYSIKDICNISYLVDRLLDKTLFVEGQLLMHTGKQALANIYKFIDIVNHYENANMSTLEEFIDYIEIIKEEFAAEGIIESEDSDVVKLLTIHKSKGLQFTVVIIPEMSRDIRSFYPRFLFNKEIGIGIKSDDIRIKYETIKAELDALDKEERKRVLYVAMTRAEKMLILGNQGKSKGFKGLIEDFLDPRYFNITSNVEINQESTQQVKIIDEKYFMNNISVASLPLLSIGNVANKRFERYSISQFLNFKSCKRSFYLDYYNRLNLTGDYKYENIEEEHIEEEIIDKNTISAIDKGNIIHKFCEYYNSESDKKALLEKIASSYGINYSDKLYKDLEPFLNNYITYYNNNDSDTVYIEKSFYLNLGDNYITGIIDRINIKGDTIQIVDIKTNRLSNKEYLVNHYQPQLAFYVYAVEKIMKKKVNKATILFLESGEEVSIDTSSTAIADVLNQIMEFIEFVDNNNSVEAYTSTNSCNDYCKHRNICEGIGK